MDGKDILVASSDWEAQGQGKKSVAPDVGDMALGWCTISCRKTALWPIFMVCLVISVGIPMAIKLVRTTSHLKSSPHFYQTEAKYDKYTKNAFRI